jgi:hypothetical protein
MFAAVIDFETSFGGLPHKDVEKVVCHISIRLSFLEVSGHWLLARSEKQEARRLTTDI